MKLSYVRTRGGREQAYLFINEYCWFEKRYSKIGKISKLKLSNSPGGYSNE